jgi:integrase
MADMIKRGISRGQQPPKKKYYGWASELNALIEENNHLSIDSRKLVSVSTRRKRDETLFNGFRALRAFGYKIENPRNFREEHMRVLARHWESEGQSAATIQNKISVFRLFSGWIGKGNMIKSGESYVSRPDAVKRTYVAQQDKSWSTNGVNFEEIWNQIAAFSKEAGAQLRMIQAFGLRREESICFKPNLHWDEENNVIRVRDGTKGGRERIIPIENQRQLDALRHARTIAGQFKKAHLGYPGLTLEQAINRFAYVVRKFGIRKDQLGVTAHGLRHEYANDAYEKRAGVASPVRGGDKNTISREQDRAARLETSELLGHSRESVTAAYYGAQRDRKRKKL